MACERCNSDSRKSFDGEVAIHFPGLDGLNKPIVCVFPRLSICLNCGFTDFTVPARELSVLVECKAAEPGAIVLDQSA